MVKHLNPLQRAFLEDHRHLTRGLVDIIDALERGDDARARREARTLDVRVGPHMAFEEQVFYPELTRMIGSADVTHLYEDHDSGRRAVRRLVAAPDETPLGDSERASILEELRGMIRHAEGCGTLLSHLEGLAPEHLGRLLEELTRLRNRGVRWTELPTHSDA